MTDAYAVIGILFLLLIGVLGIRSAVKGAKSPCDWPHCRCYAQSDCPHQ